MKSPTIQPRNAFCLQAARVASRSRFRQGGVFLAYCLVSFYVLHLFMLTWGFRGDYDKRFAFRQMMSYSSTRPFIYRTLVPRTINAISALFPDKAVESRRLWLTSESPVIKYEDRFRSEEWDARLCLKYHLTYLLLFAVLVLLLYSMRRLIELLYSPPSALIDLAPAAGLLLLPLTFSEGGYFYDFPELLFMGLSLLCLLRARLTAYLAVFTLAVLNKESGVLLVLYFLAFYWREVLVKRKYLAYLAAQVAIGSVINLSMRWAYASWPGCPYAIPNFLHENIPLFFSPGTYLTFFDPYHLGLPVFPRGFNALTILTVSFLVLHRWAEKPAVLRRLFLMTMAVVFPVWVYAGYPPEIRALSLIFPAVFLLAFHTVARPFLIKAEKR